jgi:hypothetical protein
MAWYKSKRGWVSTALAVLFLILDRWGQLTSARDIYRLAIAVWPGWSRVAPAIPWVFLGLAFIFFELERRKSNRPASHDTSTLRGRTLKLRDDIQAFWDSAPPGDDRYTGVTRTEDILRWDGNGERIAKLHYGYGLRFSENLWKLFYEFGERNAGVIGLEAILKRPIKNEEFYKLLVAKLTDLAEVPEAK